MPTASPQLQGFRGEGGWHIAYTKHRDKAVSVYGVLAGGRGKDREPALLEASLRTPSFF